MTRLVLPLGFFFVLLIGSSCGGSIFKVKPVADLPPLPTFTDGWKIGTPDLVLTMNKPFEVQAKGDIPTSRISK